MVIEALGTSPQRLARLHKTDSTEGVVAWFVAVAARHLDRVHEQLTDAAERATSTLTRVATGKSQINSLGVLPNSLTNTSLTAAQRLQRRSRPRRARSLRRRRLPTNAPDHHAQPARLPRSRQTAGSGPRPQGIHARPHP
jgi:hypothetical protein